MGPVLRFCLNGFANKYGYFFHRKQIAASPDVIHHGDQTAPAEDTAVAICRSFGG